MHLWIKGRNRNAKDSVRAFVEGRVISKLSRVFRHVRSIAIAIRDVNGPRGGVDHVIRIIIRLTSGGRIVVRHRALDTYTGAPIAIQRAVRAVRRELGRRRSTRREAYRRNLVVQARL
jgi:ribosome-associated translation inhibitor RaiA